MFGSASGNQHVRLHFREFFASLQVREQFRYWAYNRPLLGLVVPDKQYTPPPITVYIVRHSFLNAYLRNPRAQKFGPIWGSRRQACEFDNEYLAEISLADAGLDGKIMPVQKAR